MFSYLRKRIEECFGWLKDMAVAQTAASWIVQGGMDLRPCGCGVRSGADAESEKAVATNGMRQAEVCFVSGIRPTATETSDQEQLK